MTLYEEVKAILNKNDFNGHIKMWGGWQSVDDEMFAKGDVKEEALDAPFPNGIRLDRALIGGSHTEDYTHKWAVYQFWRDGETCYIHFDSKKLHDDFRRPATNRWEVELVGYEPVFKEKK